MALTPATEFCFVEIDMGILGDQKDFARDIKITVVSQKGRGCRGNHFVGQTFYIVDALTPQGLCMNAFAALMPSLNLLMFNGQMPWGSLEKIQVACPDGETQTIFELSVVKPDEADAELKNLRKNLEKRQGKFSAGPFQQGRR